jgi:sialic acid synthase
MDRYSDYQVGYSDHTIGISAPVAAVAMGARIIEKHITIDRRMKGSDQAGSLGPDGVNRMVRDIRLTELSMGEKGMFVADGLEATRLKLERSIATKNVLPKGHTIKESDLHLLSPGDGFRWADLNSVVGKTTVCEIRANEVVYPNQIGS